MKRRSPDNLFQASNALKILAFLLERPGQELLPGEILKATGLSRAGIYLALRRLLGKNLIIERKRGRFATYSADYANPVVKQVRIMSNLVQLTPLLQKLSPLAKKVVLFGSVSRGEDYPDSDIDLFVLSQDPEGVREVISKAKLKRKLQAIIKTPSEYPGFVEKNQTFAKEIDRGIVLGEEKE